MKKESKSAIKTLVTAIVISEVLIMTGSCVSHKSKEGTIINKPSVTSSQETDNNVDETEIMNDYDNDIVTSDEYETSVYEMISNKGYELDNYPDFQHEVLEIYSYDECENDIGVTTSGLNFRTGPSKEYPIIKELKANSRVNLIARCENGWYLVQVDGNLGFVSGSYIREMNIQNLNEQMSILPKLIPVVQATSDVDINYEPSDNAENIEVLRKGDYLPINSRFNNEWYEVLYDGEIGYVRADSVREASIVNGSPYKMVTLAEDATISDAPFGYEMGVVSLYEAAKVYGEVDQYYYAESGGYIGYLPKNSCVDLNGRYVIVDVSEQTATLYQDAMPLYSTYVVTGDDATPSDLGLFDIDDKERNVELEGPGYSVSASYFMPYTNGEGLHDATWRGVFGGEYYHYDGSPGCVNMPLDAAEIFYDNVEVGDNVLVKR